MEYGDGRTIKIWGTENDNKVPYLVAHIGVLSDTQERKQYKLKKYSACLHGQGRNGTFREYFAKDYDSYRDAVQELKVEFNKQVEKFS